ncbi:MAG: hypothetical protein J0I08_20775 [Rhizobiales bacterium]|nr:hypothetical protein [Hyphomicrobiales bacterium]
MSDGVKISQYDRPSDDMMKRARDWLEAALLSPASESEFQQRLTWAESAEAISFDDAMTLAQAALIVSSNGCEQNFAGWYRDRAAMLLCRAYDAVALEREARAATDAGKVQ